MTTSAQPGPGLLGLYDRALPQVYGYLLARCANRAVAEDLTAETFLAAAAAPATTPVSVAWLIGVARHKLADHWRQQSRQDRLLEAVGDPTDDVDPWEGALDVLLAREILAGLAPHHRAALTLRYVDDLSVPETAAVLDRTLHATEALLVRARRAFRHEYEKGRSDA